VRLPGYEIAGDGAAVIGTAFGDQCVSLSAGFLVAEGDFSVGCGEHANRGSADAARSSGDERYFSGERER
jgi:hypothetical protein